MNKKSLILAVVLSVSAVAAGFLIWQKISSTQDRINFQATPTVKQEPEPESLGAQIFQKSRNPLKDELPQTNPFETETNPFKNIYKNPFN